jgi:hypothetical protein
MYVSKPKCNVLYGWMSVDGIQICVDGVAVAVPAETRHIRTAANATRLMLRSRDVIPIIASFVEKMADGTGKSRRRAMRISRAAPRL